MQKLYKPIISLMLLLMASLASAQIPTSGLVHRFTFNSSLANNTGSYTLAGASGNYVADRNGNPNAAQNVTTQISNAGIPNLPLGNAIGTVSFWYQSNSKKDHVLFAYGDGAKWFMINYLATSEMISLWNTGLDVSHPYTGEWAHIAITSTGNLATVYINGVQRGSIATAFSIDGNPVSMFGGASGQHDYKIDDLLIYNRALTAQEITTIYNDACPTNATPAKNLNICPGSTTTLSATGSDVKWYDAATGGNEVGTGNTFTTPEINSAVTYYAEASSCADRVGVAINISICAVDVCAGLVAAYSFQNSLNDRLTDGSPFSGGTFTTDRHGEANSALVTTAGQSRTANIANLPTGSASRTVSLWFKPTSYSGSLFRYGTAGARQYFGMYFNNDGRLFLQVHTNDVLIPNSQVTLNEWHHLSVKTSGSIAYITIDGVGRGGYPISGGFATGSSPFMIGDFNGAVDDLRIYNITTFDHADLSLFYFNNYCPIPSPTVAQQPIILCAGSTLADVAVTGSNIRWYSSESPSQATEYPATTVLTEGGTVYATQTLAGEESAAIAVTIGINALVTPSFTEIGAICAGSNFTLPLISTNSITGTWSPAINNMETTSYTFTPDEGSCTTGPITMTVTITESVTPEFEQLEGVCVGENFQLPTTSVNGITGTWTPAVDNTQTLEYTFTPDQGQGECVNTATMTVTVYAAPYSTTPSQNLTVCAGQSTSLYAFGDELHWFDASEGGVLIGTGSALELASVNDNLTVYVQSGAAGCASTPRTAIDVTISNAAECSVYDADVCTGMVSGYTFDRVNTDVNGVKGINSVLTFTTDRHGLNNAVDLNEYTLKAAAIENLPSGNAARSVSLWLSVFDASGGDPRIFYYGGGAAGQMFGMNLNNYNKAAPGDMTFIGYGPAYDQAISNSNLIAESSKWHHLVAQYDGTNVSVYLDGVLLQSFARSLNTAASNAIYFGNFNGAIDDLRIYDRALSSDEIQNLYEVNKYCGNTAAPGIGSSLTFCESDHATLSDIEVPGSNIKWYSSVNTPLIAATTVLQDGATYYCTQTLNGVESAPSAVTVSITASQTPVFSQLGAVCAGGNIELPTTSENGITGTWSPEINSQQTTTYTFTADVNGCTESVTMTVQVTQQAIPEFTQVAAICKGETLSDLPTTSENGITGTWSPAINTEATTTYTFTAADGECAATASMTIVVNEPTIPAFELASSICIGDEAMALPTTSINGVSGSWSPTFSNTETTTYTFTPEAGICAASVEHTITVNQLVTPTFEMAANICVDQELILTTTSVEGIEGTWSPAPNSQESTTYTFTPAAGQCASTTTFTVSVGAPVTPLFDEIPAICAGESFELPAVSKNGISGTWSSEANNQTTTTYTFKPSISCANTTELTVVVNPVVTPAFDLVASICAGSELAALPTTSLNGISGTWSPAVNNQETTTYTFTPSGETCAQAVTKTIVVNQPTEPTFMLDTEICTGANFNLPSISLNGITGSWSPAFNNLETTTYTFTPSASSCATTFSATITVVDQVTPAFSFEEKMCKYSEFILPETSNNGISGSWSPAFNDELTTTYTFTPDENECAVSVTKTIIIENISEVVTLSNGTLTAAQAGADYRWFDCSLESYIDGATAQTYTPTESGDYGVEITLNECTVYSECFSVEILEEILNAPKVISSLEIYPNPAQEFLNVEVKESVQISILSVTGQTLHTHMLKAGSNRLEIKSMKSGVYIIRSAKGDYIRFIKD